MRLISVAVVVLSSLPSFLLMPDGALLAYGKANSISPIPCRHSGIRAIQRAAAKRRNQRRSRR